MVLENRSEFLRSLGDELDVQASRVRNLIGDAHWPTDGYYKETLLRSLLERHVPSSTLARRGFIVDPFGRQQCSKEQDILILNAREAPLFLQSEFAISFSSNVLASISVKSSFRGEQLRDAIHGLLGRPVIFSAASSYAPWFGIYFFQSDDDRALDRYADNIRDCLLALNGQIPKDIELCARLTENHFARVVTRGKIATADVFKTERHSTGLFLARLLGYITSANDEGPSSLADLVDAEVAEATETARCEFSPPCLNLR